ncbi:MAG: efflux RND transporter permease subunit, partial [Limnochordia bacterium]
MNIPSFAVRRPVTTAMFFIALTLLGLFSLSRLAIDLIPELAFPSLSISTSYSGAAPEEVERLITIPIEQSVSTVSGVVGMSSLSREGSSRVTLQFDWGTDLDMLINEVQAQVDRVRSRLPEGASAPRVGRFDPSQMPIMTIGISGDLDLAELRRLAEEEMTYYLERLEGVGSVTVQGGRNREIRVELDPLRLQAHGLTIDQVAGSIRGENLNVPAGRMVVGQSQFTLRTLGELTAVEELAGILVANRDGAPTFLGDIAEIQPISDDLGTIVRVDGRPGVVVSIQKQSGANTVQVADAILQTLEELKLRYPDLGIRALNDSSIFIRQTIKNVIDAGLLGGVLAAIILLIFVRSLRATIIICLAIPVSIISSFILIERAGMTLNTMSLGGLALGIGMLVDNSIVVLENIDRHLQGGKEAGQAAIDGTGEIISAVVASTLTTVAVFLPMLFVRGMTGILFQQLSLMVAFSLSCSLVVALALVPMLASRLLTKGVANPWSAATERFFLQGERRFSRLVGRAMHHPGLVILGSAVLLVGSLALVPYLGTELMTSPDEGEISISISLPTGTRLEVTDGMIRYVEDLVRTHVPELAAMESQAGGSSTDRGSLTLRLVGRGQRERSTEEIVNDLRTRLNAIPGVSSRIWARSNFAERLMSGSIGGGSERISLNVQGYDRELIRQTAEGLRGIIEGIPGVVNVGLSRDAGQPEFVIEVDRQRAADLGLTASQVAQSVQAAVQGRVATQLRVGGREYSVRVATADPKGLTPQEVEMIPIPIGGGSFVPLASVGNLVQRESPVAIERLNQQRTIRVTASTEGRDLGSVVADIREGVANYPLPDGVHVHFGGEYEEQQRAFRELVMVFLLAISLVYIVMASQFESLLEPFIVMFSVPFALVGVILTLFLTKTPLTTQAFMGLIVLGGIVVNNAIVLITYMQMLRERGMDLEQAVITAAERRLRPILMTTATTVLGLVPLALELGEGTELQAPLARTVIGGLVASTFVTLFLIPTLYCWIYRRRLYPVGRVMGSIILVLLLASATTQAGELTLQQAWSEGLQGHPSVLDAQRDLAAAESRLRQLEATYGLQLDLDYQLDLGGELVSLEHRGGSIILNASQVLLVPGENLALRAARLRVEEGLAALASAKEGAKLEILAAYLELWQAQGELAAAELALERLEGTAQAVEQRFERAMAGE